MMASGEIYTYLLKDKWDFGTIRGATSIRKVCRESPSIFGSSNLSLMSFCLPRGEGLVPRIMNDCAGSFMNSPRRYFGTGWCVRGEMNLNWDTTANWCKGRWFAEIGYVAVSYWWIKWQSLRQINRWYGNPWLNLGNKSILLFWKHQILLLLNKGQLYYD